MDEPYASRLKGQLHFGDLASAEESIRKLSAIYDEYHALQDRIGMRLVRSIVLKGKERAQSLAANPRVSGGKKREKQEIATWFRVWLETPEIFLDWLGLRKQSEEFRCLFPTVLNEGEFERQHSQSPTE